MATTTYYETPGSVRPLYRGTQIVWYILGIIEVLLGFRFILRLIAANPAAGFTHFINTVTQPLVQPFANIVRVARVTGSTATGVVDWNVIIAMAVYWLLAWAIVRLFFMGRPVSEAEADYEIRKENNQI
ncbi:MAG: YggT family protein [Candidatus Doudnabacteria bacterium]|nr:YggT family protein [Candidatus Doudnabacteria bacterium]